MGDRSNNIDINSTLLALSQISLGLAGFSAILVALSGSPHQWTPIDSYRIKNMLAFSFQGIFFALVPVSLALFAIPQRALWQISLLVLGAGTLGGALLAFAGFLRLPRPGRLVMRPALVYSIVTALVVAALIEMIFSTRSVAFAPGVFFAGLLALQGTAVYLVARFLFARPAA